MLALIPLAISLVPALVRLIAGDKAGTVASTVGSVVAEVTGTSDPVEAQRKIAEDPAIAANLRIRLAEISLEAQKAQNEEADKQRQADLDAMRASLADTANARATMLGTVQAGSWLASAPALVSAIVTIGFFTFMIYLLHHGLPRDSTDDRVMQVINIVVGALTTGFATVINFWLGSSQGSRDKDAIVRTFQAAQGDQTREAIQSLRNVATTIVSNQPVAPVRTAGTPGAAVAPATSAAAPPPATASGATSTASDEARSIVPVSPAPTGILTQILPSLRVQHHHFADGVAWALTPKGISIDGAPARGTAGEATTVRDIWKRYGDLCVASAKRYGVPVELIVSTVATESGGNPNARRQEPRIGDESVGLMQTLVGTARSVLGRRDLTGDDLLDPGLSIAAGTAYIAQQLGATHFDPPLMAAAYNAGSIRHDPAEANRWKLVCFPLGTGHYIDNFTSWFGDSMVVSAQDRWGAADEAPSFAAALLAAGPQA
jgi:soluble lytic murein transglycosylase-like protein